MEKTTIKSTLDVFQKFEKSIKNCTKTLVEKKLQMQPVLKINF